MTKEKNKGCKECEYFKEVYHYFRGSLMREYLGESCNNDKAKKTKTTLDPIKGKITTRIGEPKELNKNLDCKGFTPIDYKKKCQESEQKKITIELESMDSSEGHLKTKLILDEGTDWVFVAYMAVIVFLLGGALGCALHYLKGCS